MSIRALILLVLVLSSLANAQSANWLEVPQPAIGKRVIVALKTGSTQRGILEIVEPDSLTIKGHAAIARADVRTVRVRQGMTRGKRAAR